MDLYGNYTISYQTYIMHSFLARTLIRQPGGENYAIMYVRQEIVQFPYRFKSNHNVLYSKRNKVDGVY